MNHKEFSIGTEFYYMSYGLEKDYKKYRCTDIGARTIIAICIDSNQLDNHGEVMDESWFTSPPFAVVEYVFDEYDQCACMIEKDEDDSKDDSKEDSKEDS